MADLRWIEKTVNTAGRPCPHRLAERCPGERSGCVFWLDELMKDDAGHAEQVSGCLFLFQYVMAHEVTDECKRTQAALGQQSNTLDAASKRIMGAAVLSRLPLATGGSR